MLALYGKGINGFGYHSTAEDVTKGMDLSGKTYLITGINSGVGHECGRVLSLRGANVIGLARTEEKACEAMKLFSGKGERISVACDLENPKSVKSAVDSVVSSGKPLDAIVCNAGIMGLPKLELVCGYEKQFFTNHVGHFILVNGLLNQLTDNGRVVMLSSTAHSSAPKGGVSLDNLDGSKSYGAWSAYGQSKMANLLMAKSLAKKFEEGAATQTYLATQEGIEGDSGKYFTDCNVDRERKNGSDMDTADKLWEKTESIVAGLDFN
eukprot:CFRG3945T1